MRSVRWMLAVGYGCLALTAAWALRVREAPVRDPWSAMSELVPGSAAPAAAPMVLLLLHPRDCAERIEALTAWNALHDSGRARVVGLVSDGAGASDALVAIGKGAGLEFPLRPISHRRMVAALRGLNYNSTPVLVVLDPQKRLRLAVPLYDRETAAPMRAVTRTIEELLLSDTLHRNPFPQEPTG